MERHRSGRSTVQSADEIELCHTESSEESVLKQILHFIQDDNYTTRHIAGNIVYWIKDHVNHQLSGDINRGTYLPDM